MKWPPLGPSCRIEQKGCDSFLSSVGTHGSGAAFFRRKRLAPTPSLEGRDSLLPFRAEAGLPTEGRNGGKAKTRSLLPSIGRERREARSTASRRGKEEKRREALPFAEGKTALP